MCAEINRRTFVTAGSAATLGLLAGPQSIHAKTEEAAETATVPKTLEVVEGSRISLPRPNIQGGLPLMETLAKRKTTRSFQTRMVDLQTLSDFLWAAFGVSRPDGRRTAPSALNSQEI